MQMNEFETQLNRLVETFSEKVVSNERKRLLWEALKNVEARYFSLAVDGLLKYQKYTPTPGDIIQAVKLKGGFKLTGDQEAVQRQIDANGYCSTCENTGVVLAYQIPPDEEQEIKVPYAFCCTCYAGERYKYPYPKWTHFFKKKYRWCNKDFRDRKNITQRSSTASSVTTHHQTTYIT